MAFGRKAKKHRILENEANITALLGEEE